MARYVNDLDELAALQDAGLFDELVTVDRSADVDADARLVREDEDEDDDDDAGTVDELDRDLADQLADGVVDELDDLERWQDYDDVLDFEDVDVETGADYEG